MLDWQFLVIFILKNFRIIFFHSGEEKTEPRACFVKTVGDFPKTVGDFFKKHGDFFEKHGDFFEKHGDFFEKHGDFFKKHGDFFLKAGRKKSPTAQNDKKNGHSVP